jgi:hypothetical protein
MAYRKTYSHSKKWRVRDSLQLLDHQQGANTHLIFLVHMHEMGVTDLPSYFRRCLLTIVIGVVVGAAIGGHRNGLEGAAWGALVGVVAPAALIWLWAVLIYVFVFLAVFFAAWVAIVHGVLWIASL